MLRLLRRASHRRPTRACGPVRAQCTAWWSAARRPCCRRRMRPTCGAGWRRGARGGRAASGGTAPTRRARARARPASAGTRSTCARSPARPCAAGSSLEAPWSSWHTVRLGFAGPRLLAPRNRQRFTAPAVRRRWARWAACCARCRRASARSCARRTSARRGGGRRRLPCPRSRPRAPTCPFLCGLVHVSASSPWVAAAGLTVCA